ncbi:hypothetical protein HaLaN_07989, partial [Haematococcus lacustris]
MPLFVCDVNIPDLYNFQHKEVVSVQNQYGKSQTVSHPAHFRHASAKEDFNDMFVGLIGLHLRRVRPDLTASHFRQLLAVHKFDYPLMWSIPHTPTNMCSVSGWVLG